MSAEAADANHLNFTRVQKYLLAGESLLLVVQPRLGMRRGALLAVMVPAVVILALLLYALLGMQGAGGMVVLCGVPFWLLAGVLLVAPLWYRWYMARTLYLLTDRRVLIVEPRLSGGERARCFPLRPNPVQKVVHHGGDYGDIVFAWEYRWRPGPYMFSPVEPVGFMAVPQVLRVVRLLEEQVAAVPADAEMLPAAGVKPLPLDRRGRPRACTLERMSAMWLGVGACVVSFLLLLVGAFRLPQEQLLWGNTATTTATVHSLRREVSDWNTHVNAEREYYRTKSGVRRAKFVLYYPTVRFRDAAGVEHLAELSEPQKSWRVQPDSKHRITYSRDNVQRVCLGEPSRRGLALCLLSPLAFLVGAAFVAAGIVAFKKQA